MADVLIQKLNELYVRIQTDKGIEYEMYEHFSYYVEGYKYMPKYKSGVWDGKIRLYSIKTKSIYSGLTHEIIKFCERYGYTYDVDARLKPLNVIQDLKEFKKNIPSICKLDPYDYQMDALLAATIENKTLILSPTGSGKSLIIYLMIRFLLNIIEENVLIVVPTTTLVEQLSKDFDSYDPDGIFSESCHKIYSGKEKHTNKRVTITTWQSVFRLPAEWFSTYGAVIVDEAHQADSSSITGIVDKMPHARFRTGLTGTLDGTKSHELFMRGIFGKVIKTTTTRKLMDDGKLADLDVCMFKLKYPKDECKAVTKLKYQDEIKYLVYHDKRNKFLVNLSMSYDNNTLLLFNFVGNHGKKIFEMAQSRAEKMGKQVYLIHGETPVEERERIRALVETDNNIVIYASSGVFSTGINMKNLHVVIFAHPYKSKIRNLQSIGRGLRTSSGKTKALLVDVCDDFTYNERHNTAYDHSIARLKIYESEQFNYTIKDIEIQSDIPE